MSDTPRLPRTLGKVLARRRVELGLSKKAVAERAGRVREVVYRLERGDDVSLLSLFDVLRALHLVLSIEPAGMPSMEELAAVLLEGDEAP